MLLWPKIECCTQICLLRVSFKNVVYDNFQDIATSLPGSYTVLSREYTKFIKSISIHFIQKYKPLVTKTFLFLECYCSQFFNNHSRLGQFVLYISSGCNTDIVLQSHCSYLRLYKQQRVWHAAEVCWTDSFKQLMKKLMVLWMWACDLWGVSSVLYM